MPPPHPNPCVVLLALFFDSDKMTFLDIFLVLFFYDSDEMMFLGIFDMYLIVFVIFSQYLFITLLIHKANMAVTVTDSGDRN